METIVLDLSSVAMVSLSFGYQGCIYVQNLRGRRYRARPQQNITSLHRVANLPAPSPTNTAIPLWNFGIPSRGPGTVCTQMLYPRPRATLGSICKKPCYQQCGLQILFPLFPLQDIKLIETHSPVRLYLRDSIPQLTSLV